MGSFIQLSIELKDAYLQIGALVFGILVWINRAFVPYFENIQPSLNLSILNLAITKEVIFIGSLNYSKAKFPATQICIPRRRYVNQTYWLSLYPLKGLI